MSFSNVAIRFVEEERVGCFTLSLYLIETPVNIFANRAGPDQAAQVRDPTLVDLTSNFIFLCTNMNVFYIIIHSGQSLA